MGGRVGGYGICIVLVHLHMCASTARLITPAMDSGVFTDLFTSATPRFVLGIGPYHIATLCCVPSNSGYRRGVKRAKSQGPKAVEVPQSSPTLNRSSWSNSLLAT